MLLTFDEEQKKHLAFLANAASEVVEEFCNISLGYLRQGVNPKVYQKAAQKLDVDASTIQHAVEGLVYLFVESAKLMLNKIDFQDSVSMLGFGEQLASLLLQTYLENQQEIRNLLGHVTIDMPHYANLEWRLDVQLASRSLRHQTVPQVLLKLSTAHHQKQSVQMLQTDTVNLIHLTKSLEDALQEVKSSHSRRILRNI